MRDLLILAEPVAALLRKRKETVAVAESSAGGLISAALLAVPGASDYYIGGTVIYTGKAWYLLRDFSKDLLGGFPSAAEENALIRGRIRPDRFGGGWGNRGTGAGG